MLLHSMIAGLNLERTETIRLDEKWACMYTFFFNEGKLREAVVYGNKSLGFLKHSFTLTSDCLF